MMQSSNEKPFRAGFVAIVGRPNVGKSTLLNALLGTKVSIVSPKPQTTRTLIHGILNLPHAQLVLVDTPGFCKDRGPLTRALRQVAGTAAADADMSLVVAEVRGDSAELSEADREVLTAARRSSGQLLLAINKIDLLPRKESLLPWMAAYAREFELSAVVPISARTGDGLEELTEELIERLPESPPLFPIDMHTDQAERFLCAELIREQLLMQTQEEVPHSAAVTVEHFEDFRDDPRGPLVRLEARVYVERDSQKAIVIGRGGHQIKALGQASRERIEELLDAKVYLRLTVHVDKQWTTNERALRRYGLMPEAQQR
jgi:GTP-binding protein Era